MNKSELTPLWKAANSNLSSISSTVKASLLKWVMKDRKLSLSPCFIVSKLDEECLYLWPPMKLLTNNLLNFWKELTVFGGILLKHTCASPLRVVGKALHIISSRTPWRYIVVLKVVMWIKGWQWGKAGRAGGWDLHPHPAWLLPFPIPAPPMGARQNTLPHPCPTLNTILYI